MQLHHRSSVLRLNHEEHVILEDSQSGADGFDQVLPYLSFRSARSVMQVLSHLFAICP